MKAYIIKKYGKKEHLQLVELPEPLLSDNDILVRVHSAALNPLDSKIKNGDFKLILPYKLPLVLGHDVAGEVIRIGSRVHKFQVGDRVYSRPADHRIGAFAELIAIHEDDAAIMPKNLTMEEAASIPLVGLTAWQALIEKAGLTEGQKVFIQAGSGGVGAFAVQLAKYLGATVATTAGAANFEMVQSLGADIVIDYRQEDFEEKLKDFDVVLNSQDAATLEKSLSVLKRGGKLVSISGPPDADFANEIGASWLLKSVFKVLSLGIRRKAKRRGVSYSFLFMRAQGAQLDRITSLIESGKIRPVVDKVFPFEMLDEALAYVESGRVKGKVVLKMR
ncbi:NADP-dependent oxidoreductase [Leptonema illini]|uniref:Alcohol dehydrogenase zinc-binding domain protein n=1 Tax=Leptonema illini DSM 21528 TaxID=929563 RepID=H2CGJ7_9LEPT|nr:NADP-dependent oxidoreductase [Leptonema illini]EHQ07914.1 Alcohol dehydrogenase zinc-binding domain protein [Leptonema illini DSM 21528]